MRTGNGGKKALEGFFFRWSALAKPVLTVLTCEQFDSQGTLLKEIEVKEPHV